MNNYSLHGSCPSPVLLGSCPCLFEQTGQNLASIQFKKIKELSLQKMSFYTIIGILQCKNRDCPAGIENFGRSVGVVIPLPPTDHFCATSLKILFARIDRGSDRVASVCLSVIFCSTSIFKKAEKCAAAAGDRGGEGAAQNSPWRLRLTMPVRKKNCNCRNSRCLKLCVPFHHHGLPSFSLNPRS